MVYHKYLRNETCPFSCMRLPTSITFPYSCCEFQCFFFCPLDMVDLYIPNLSCQVSPNSTALWPCFWFWRGRSTRPRQCQELPGVPPLLLHTRCWGDRQVSPLRLTLGGHGGDQPPELWHWHLGTGLAEPDISEWSRHRPGMSRLAVADRGALNSAVKLQWQLNSVRNYCCKGRIFLVYVFVIVAGIVCLLLFLNFFLSFKKCPFLIYKAKVLRCLGIGRQVASVGWERGK